MKHPKLTLSLITALAIAALLWASLPQPARSQSPVEYIVAPDGVYANPGTLADPTTLEGARDMIRALETLPAGGVTVYLRGGTYALTRTFSLGAQDTGTATAPIVYRAYSNETVTLSGGTALDPGWFSPAESTLFDRLPEAAQGNVYYVNLPAHGITDYGSLIRRGYRQYSPVSALELAFNDSMMELARWPNRGQTDTFSETAPALVTGALTPDVSGTYEYIGSAASGNADDGYPNYRRVGPVDGEQYYLYHCTWGDGGRHKYWFISPYSPVDSPNCWPTSASAWWKYASQPYPIPLMEPLSNADGDAAIRSQVEDYAQDGFVRIPEALSDTRFRFPGTRYQAWSQDNDLWFQGLFGNLWADDTLSGTVESGVVTLSDAPSYGTTTGQPFFVLNVLEELDAPGEWYLDRDTGILYFWPPAGLSGSSISVSLLEDPLVSIDDAAYITFDSITFEMGRAELIDIQDGESVRVNRCTLRNNGAYAVNVTGSNNRIERCSIYNNGAGGVQISGGDRPSLTDGNNVVSNCEIHHFARWDRTYRPGVRLRGCGNAVEHSEIHDAPHAAILFNGNEHRMEYNEIGYVVQEANDAGAIYSGRDWGYRGNVIAYNFIHHTQSVFGGSHGVYLDDALSGITVQSNIIYATNGVATVNGGGRDNIFRNNIIVDAIVGHSTDRRAQSHAVYTFSTSGRPDSWNLLGRINFDYDDYSALVPIAYQSGVWAEHYPALAAIPNDWAVVEDSHWLDPEGSVFSCNVAHNPGALFAESSDALDAYAEVTQTLEADPLFVDIEALDVHLQPASPIYTMTCFTPIPVDLIGILDETTFTHHVYLPLILR